MLDDRDFAMHVTWRSDGDKRVIEFHTTNASIAPPEKGVVRVPLHEGSWILEPIDGGLGTRLIVRSRIPQEGFVEMLVIEPASFVFERRMLLGLRQHAEGN